MNGQRSVTGGRYEKTVLLHKHQRPNVSFMGPSHALRILVVLYFEVIDVVEDLGSVKRFNGTTGKWAGAAVLRRWRVWR